MEYLATFYYDLDEESDNLYPNLRQCYGMVMHS